MTNKFAMGIDPGGKGCLCLLSEDKQTIHFFDWPTNRDARTYFNKIINFIDQEQINVTFAVLERVHAMPKQGLSSTFTFGINYGRWLTFLDINNVSYVTILPQVWQRDILSKNDGVSPKARAYIAAKRMYPQATLQGPQGGIRDGRVDALLIATYASRQSS